MKVKRITSLSKTVTQGFRHFRGCWSMGRDDVVLASFPRSGSTWFRTIIANCLNLKDGQDANTQLIDLADRMPVLGYSDLGRGGPKFYQPRLIKTHRLPGEIKPFRPKQILQLWREPVGVMKSCFRYYSANRNFQTSDLSSLIRDSKLGMPAWKKHYLDWKPLATVTLDYNQMRDNTVVEVSRVLKAMGCDDLLPKVARAVELANLENMKKAEKQGIPDPERFDKSFATIGGSVSDATKFSESDRQYIESMTDGMPLPYLENPSDPVSV